jgi:hypothetical protein
MTRPLWFRATHAMTSQIAMVAALRAHLGPVEPSTDAQISILWRNIEGLLRRHGQ